MKPDLRPEWAILCPLLVYTAFMLALAWAARTLLHMPMYPAYHASAPRRAR